MTETLSCHSVTSYLELGCSAELSLLEAEGWGQALGSGAPPPREEMCDLGEPGPLHEGGGSVIPGEDFGRELSAGNTSGRRSNEGPGPRRRDVGTQHSIPYKYQPQGLSGRVTCSEDLHMIVREHAHTSGSINGG